MTVGDVDALVHVARAHAHAEAAGDLDGTLATLDPDPTYELLPMGVTLRGRDFVRAYYQRFFTECMPRFVGYELRNEWVMDDGLGQEYRVETPPPDGPRPHDILGILTFGDHGLLSGERLYASDEMLRFLFGPLLPSPTSAHHADLG
jgi:hypothetical protein